ncbi:hypothetical protein LPMP_130730 [Leishmania panamensis]|uniref:Uncharacterized protein n=1 Tax=Leishmania panamensis TaxID=5679 RepID=A0A088RKE9_LEIPA|nr:hypothetical protein LPMP_130730 [Leishmania panamensis]AIN96502.1 hypothetical protein LPMP_130730 [Leishmania panamensis]
MVDLAEAQVPMNISDAAAMRAAAHHLGEPTHSRRRHHHCRRSSSPSKPRHSRRSSSAAAAMASASYLTEELHFDVQARETQRANERRRGQRYASSASPPGLDANQSYNCASGARFCSTATSWHSLTPDIQWIPYLLKDDSEEHHGHANGRRDESSGKGAHIGSDVRVNAQPPRAVLQGAARSAAVMIVGMRHIREALLATAVATTTVSADDTGRSSRHRSRRGRHRSSSRSRSLYARSDSVSSDASAEASLDSTPRSYHRPRRQSQEERKTREWRRRESREAHRQQFSTVVPLDGARHSSTPNSLHGLGHIKGGELPSTSFASTALPSRSQRRSSGVGGSRLATTAAATETAASDGAWVYPAPPPSERVHIYPCAGERGHDSEYLVGNGGSATVELGAAVSPLRYHQYSAATTDASTTATSFHVHRKLEWRTTETTTPVQVNIRVIPADRPAESKDALNRLKNESTSPTSLAQLVAQRTASPRTHSRLPPSYSPCSAAVATARSASQVHETPLTHEEAEARLHIVMAHSCQLVRILCDHYERLRELEWESKQHLLATTIRAAAGEDGAMPVAAAAPVTAASIMTSATVPNNTAGPVNSPSPTQSSPSLSASTVSAHTEMSSEVAMSPSAQIPSTPTTAGAAEILDTYAPSSPSLRQQPEWEKRSTRSSRTSPAPSSAAASYASQFPARPLSAHHVSPAALDDGSAAGALTTSPAAAAAPKVPASTGAPAPRLPAHESQLLSPPPVRSWASSYQQRIAATVVEEYAECTPPMARQAYSRHSHGTTCPLLSPSEESAEEVAEESATSDFGYKIAAVSTCRKHSTHYSTDSSSSSSTATYLVAENVELRASSGTATITTVSTVTANDPLF